MKFIDKYFKQIKDTDWVTEVQDSPIPVVVEFFRDSCSSCRVFEATLVEVAELYEGRLKFLRMDTEESSYHFKRLQGKGEPFTVVFYKGENEGELLGAFPTHYFLPQFKAILARMCVKHQLPEIFASNT